MIKRQGNVWDNKKRYEFSNKDRTKRGNNKKQFFHVGQKIKKGIGSA